MSGATYRREIRGTNSVELFSTLIALETSGEVSVPQPVRRSNLWRRKVESQEERVAVVGSVIAIIAAALVVVMHVAAVVAQYVFVCGDNAASLCNPSVSLRCMPFHVCMVLAAMAGLVALLSVRGPVLRIVLSVKGAWSSPGVR